MRDLQVLSSPLATRRWLELRGMLRRIALAGGGERWIVGVWAGQRLIFLALA